MSEWKAFIGRISLFAAMTPTPSLPSARDLYLKIWRREPNSFQGQTNPLIPTTAQGMKANLILNCAAQPSRIDFSISAASTSPGHVDLIESSTELRNELDSMIRAFNDDTISNDVLRVALYLHFLKVVPGSAEANSELIGVIPRRYGVKVTNEDDFIFQINRPRVAQTIHDQDMKMNLITKWSVDRVQVISLSFPLGGAPASEGMASPFSQTQVFLAASVHFDYNNTPSIRSLTGPEQSGLLLEALQGVVETQQEIGLDVGSF